MDFMKIMDATNLIKDVSRLIVSYYGHYKYPYMKQLKECLKYMPNGATENNYVGTKIHTNVVEIWTTVSQLVGKEINYRPIIPKHIVDKYKIIYKEDKVYKMHKYTKRRNLPWPSSLGDSSLLTIGRQYHLHSVERTYIQEVNGKVDIYITQWVVDSKSGDYMYEIKFKIY